MNYLKSRYCIREDIIEERIDEEIVLVDVIHDRYFSMNSSACWFWEQLGLGLSVGEILERAREFFEGFDEQDGESDFIVLINSLKDRGLIKEKE